jgi:benzoyl-CoA reductase subunit C
MTSGDSGTALDTLREVLSDPGAVARDWKALGKKVVGYRCIYVPEEIIWAAGMLPHPIYGTPEPIVLADAYFQSCSCEFVRNIFDHALGGRYSFLDHLVLANTCEFSRGLFALWETYIEGIPVYMINNPLKLMEAGNHDYYRAELERFRDAMEQLSGTEVSDERLKDSIALHNETRSLLRELYDLRREDPPRITGEEAFDIVLATSLLPKDRAGPLLRRLLGEVQSRKKPQRSGPRLMVTGSIMDNPMLIRLVEEQGGQVVVDDLCTTTKYFWHQVPNDEDPIEALYRFENGRPLCTCTHPMGARLDHLQQLIEEFAVDGVVYFNLKYCHPLAYEAPIVKEVLKAKGLPCIILEVGHDMSGRGQLRTRLQAFVEMLEVAPRASRGSNP